MKPQNSRLLTARAVMTSYCTECDTEGLCCDHCMKHIGVSDLYECFGDGLHGCENCNK
jgi:hypothetical protein